MKVKYPGVKFMITPKMEWNEFNLNVHKVIERLAWIIMVKRLGDGDHIKGLIRSRHQKPSISDIKHAIKITKKYSLKRLQQMGFPDPNMSCRDL